MVSQRIIPWANGIANASIIFAICIRMAVVVAGSGSAGGHAFTGIERTLEVLLAKISICAIQKRSVDRAREKGWATEARVGVRRVGFGVA